MTMKWLQYKVNSNENVSHVRSDLKLKFADDLSILEILNLLSASIHHYDFKNHVASDVGINQLFLSTERTTTQKSLDIL